MERWFDRTAAEAAAARGDWAAAISLVSGYAEGNSADHHRHGHRCRRCLRHEPGHRLTDDLAAQADAADAGHAVAEITCGGCG
jgi:hypothetical protein